MSSFFETRRVRKILRNGGPKTPREYFTLFPEACPSCGGRRVKFTRIELDHEKRWNSFGGFYEDHNSGWKSWKECQRCGHVYAIMQSTFYEVRRPAAKSVRTVGPVEARIYSWEVNWHKLIDLEGFRVDDIPERIPSQPPRDR
jgi:rubredoxin